MNLELRQLRYFVAVAEELHFTRAAERLHMAQQPLSAAIARLEDQLGTRLFDRTTRQVALTAAGTAMLEPARAALRAAEAAEAAARAAASGAIGDLAIGVSSGAWYGLGAFFSALGERHPGLRLHVRQQSSRSIVDDVRAGRLDLGIGLCVAAAADLRAQRMKDEPVVLVVPADHPLAGAGAVELRRLERETFALDDPEDGPDYNAAVLALCAGAGIAPPTRALASHHDAWEGAIAAGECVGLTTSCSVHAAHPGVRVVDVGPPATFPLDLLWRPAIGDEPAPTVDVALRVAADVAEREGWIAQR